MTTAAASSLASPPCRPPPPRSYLLTLPLLVLSLYTSLSLPPFSLLLPARPSLAHLAARIAAAPAHAPALHATTLSACRTSFRNPWPTWTGTARPSRLLTFFLSRAYAASWLPTPPSRRLHPLPSPSLPSPPSALQATWLGHAGVLLQHAGLTYYIDPLLSRHVSPLPPFGPYRESAPPFHSHAALARAGNLSSLDFVLLTHAHYDHLSVDDLREIDALYAPHYFVPAGVERYLAESPLRVPPGRVTSLLWWESGAHSGARVTLTPAQHSSRRGPFDADATLHGGFVVEAGGVKVYAVGDSGYVPELFAEVGRVLGPFDLGVLPIGAYAPRDMHAVSHMDPVEAMRVHGEARCRDSIAVHWGTFRLTTEALLEPRELLERESMERVARGEGGEEFGDPERFRCLRPGEVFVA